MDGHIAVVVAAASSSLSSSLTRSPGRPSSRINIDSQIDIVDGRSIIGSSLCASTSAPVSGACCFLQQSGPPSRFFSLTLSQTLSLSLFISLNDWIKNEMIKWNLSLYYLISVSLSLFELWASDWLTWLTLTFFFFFFLNLVVHTLCSLASYTPALITNFFFFFGSCCTTTTMCSTVSEYLTPLISVFVFGRCVCVLGWACCILFGLDFFKAQKLWMDFEVIHCSTWAWPLELHILPKFQFWNWNLEKNNLKKFWKSYNINNIGFFFIIFY